MRNNLTRLTICGGAATCVGVEYRVPIDAIDLECGYCYILKSQDCGKVNDRNLRCHIEITLNPSFVLTQSTRAEDGVLLDC